LAAAILCIVWLLWPVIALGGGQGFIVLVELAAIIVAPVALRHIRLRWYMLPLAAFFAYAAASALWSPRPFQFIDFEPAKMQLNMRSEVARLAPLFLALLVLCAAAMRTSEKGRRRVAAFALGAMLVQVVAVVLLAAFEKQVLAFIVHYIPDSGETVQNISRNTLIMGAASPFLIFALVDGRKVWIWAPLAALVLAGEGWAVMHRDVEAALLAPLLAAGCIVVTRLLPRNGFRVLAVGLALAILTAPVTFKIVSRDGDPYTAVTSQEQRLAIWQRTIAVIEQRPIEGNGLGVLRTMRDRISTGAFKGELFIPNHPHNMALELWAETGAIGAGLLAIAIVLAGFRLPAPAALGRAAPRIAGLVGAVSAVGFVSFDLWNEWWWAVVGLLAVLAACQPSDEGRTGEARASEAAPQADALDEAPGSAAPVRSPSGASIARVGAETQNNFHLLRLLFALAVVVGHLNALSALPGWEAADRIFAPGVKLGVQGFFILSGYLVSGSFERSKSIAQYAEKRVRRLYPAYAVTVLVCAGAALAFSPGARADLAAVARYVGWNLGFLNFMEPNLPGVFTNNSMTEVNGALWTLKIEVLFYLALPLLAWLLRNSGRMHGVLILAIYIASEAWRFGFGYFGHRNASPMLYEIGRQLPGQMSFFITGVALYIWRDRLARRWLILAPVGVVLLVASFFDPLAEPLRPASLGLVAIGIATGLPRIVDAARFGDLSYGLYILHFPIIQTAVALGLFAIHPALGAAAALGVSVVGALLMWRLVERPALRADSAYRRHGKEAPHEAAA
jgi:peptidoglycan/LPS O-acetylase OafA/YrhL/O-antigen ligase